MDLFNLYGVGMLGDRGLPSPGEFVAALPLIGISRQPNADLLYRILMMAASGINQAAAEEREKRDAERRRR